MSRPWWHHSSVILDEIVVFHARCCISKDTYHDNLNFVTTSIKVILLFFSFSKFSMNLQFTACRLVSFLVFLWANRVKLCYLVLAHNCIVFGIARLCSQNSCKGMEEVFNSPANMQMYMTFHMHQFSPKENSSLMEPLADPDTSPYPDWRLKC